MMTRIINQKLTRGLGLTIPNQDWHSIKHLESMQSTGLGYKAEHEWLKTLMRDDKMDHHLLPWTIMTSIRSSIHYFNNYK